MDTPSPDSPLAISLSADEALVLFEFLSRGDEEAGLRIEDPAEDYVLTKLLGRLEVHLVAPFDARYEELLAAARTRIRDLHGDFQSPAS